MAKRRTKPVDPSVQWLTIAELADEFGVCGTTAWRWVTTGRITAFRAEAHVTRVHRDEIARFVAANLTTGSKTS